MVVLRGPSVVVNPIVLAPMRYDRPKIHPRRDECSDSSPRELLPSREDPLKQVKNGLRMGWNVLLPTAFILWIGGALADKTIRSLSPAAPTTVSEEPLSQSLILQGQKNSTSGYTFESQNKSWQQLVAFRAFLHVVSPSTGEWFESMHRDGKLVFVDNNTFFGYSRQSDFRRWNGQLTLYPFFFNLSDARKVETIEHERHHAMETLPGYISNSITPQVVMGSILKSYGTTDGARELGRIWSYYGNASEVAAIKKERSAARRLSDPELGRFDGDTDQVLPGQTELGVLILTISGVRSIKRRRKARGRRLLVNGGKG